MFVWFFTAERLSQKLFTQSKLLLTLLEVNQRTKKCVSVPPKSLRFTCSQYFKGMTGISSSYTGLNETLRSQTFWTEILVVVRNKHGWVFNHLDMFCYDRCLICCQLSPNLMNSSCHFINTRHGICLGSRNEKRFTLATDAVHLVKGRDGPTEAVGSILEVQCSN